VRGAGNGAKLPSEDKLRRSLTIGERSAGRPPIFGSRVTRSSLSRRILGSPRTRGDPGIAIVLRGAREPGRLGYAWTGCPGPSQVAGAIRRSRSRRAHRGGLLRRPKREAHRFGHDSSLPARHHSLGSWWSTGWPFACFESQAHGCRIRGSPRSRCPRRRFPRSSLRGETDDEQVNACSPCGCNEQPLGPVQTLRCRTTAFLASARRPPPSMPYGLARRVALRSRRPARCAKPVARSR
jgi:hypothetical protein